MKPNYIHDCNKCQYLGTTLGHELLDWYWCDQSGFGGTTIARYGENGPAYNSYPDDILDKPRTFQPKDVYLDQHIMARGMRNMRK